MTVFDHYIMVDWSGGSSRRGNRSDAIWIAHGDRNAPRPNTESPYSRTEAEKLVRDIVVAGIGNSWRILLCFDFAFGYPALFSAGLPGFTGPAWLHAWRYLHAMLHDDIGGKSGGKPTNRSDRFVVAENINALMSPGGISLGPFWCLPTPGAHSHISQNQPTQPFRTARGLLVGALRRTDRRGQSDTPFRVFGNGSVGSQVLTGIPRLHNLRFNPMLTQVSAVWPFETGWATKESWLDLGVRVVYAEIYPSVRTPLKDSIKDRGQVRSMWNWARDLDKKDRLWNEFSIPSGIQFGSPDDISIRTEEGWILGVR